MRGTRWRISSIATGCRLHLTFEARWGSGVSSFQWAELLQLAETLASQEKASPNEGRRRTVLGRAYYATFNAARIYAASVHGIVLGSNEKSVHTTLWYELSYKPGKVPKLANHGKQLLKLRKHADYDATPVVSEAHMREALTLARLAAQLLNEFNAPAPATPPTS